MSKPSLRGLLISQLRGQERQRERLRISQAGHCPRLVYYQATGCPGEPPSLENLIAMAIGTAVDAMVLKGHIKDWKFQVPVSITMGTLTVEGTSDAVHHTEDTPDHVADLKVVGIKTWASIQNEPKSEHSAQANLYAYGLNVPSWSVLYLNRETRQLLEHHRNTDVFVARRDFSLFEEVALAMYRGEPPFRPYEDIEEDDGIVKIAREQFPCRFCAFVNLCWDTNLEQEIA